MRRALQRLHDLPIAAKLVAIGTLTVGLAVLTVFSSVFVLECREAKKTLEEDLRVQARVIGDSCATALASGDRRSAQAILATLKATSNITAAELRDSRGQLFTAYRRGENGHRPALAFVFPKTADISLPIQAGGGAVGQISLHSDLDRNVQRLTEKALAIAFITFLALLASLAMLLFLQRSITRPLSMLTSLMTRVSTQKDYTLRARAYARDEVGRLTEAFNHMLENIQHRDRLLSHEMLARKKIERRLNRLAHYDTVTGLPNRHHFHECLHHAQANAMRAQERLAVLFIDLDNFKIINDTYGHDAGDLLLRTVGQRLKGHLRGGDTLARLGGDEFAILVENVHEGGQVGQIAQKCLEALTQPIHVEGGDIYVGATIGSALWPNDAEEERTLLRYADTAMYVAKARCKGTWQPFQPEMRDLAGNRLSMETSLRHALHRGEFMLHYQPQVDCQSSHVTSVEALIRWRHPEHGMVAPEEFIPLAEENGLIMAIGDWVLHTACRQAKAWQETGTPIVVSVNASSLQFRQHDFAHSVLAILEETGLEPKWLELELVESQLMDINDQTLKQLGALKEAGVRIAIDDFGTGYSSMGYLKLLPVHVIKIDRCFIQRLPADGDDAAIVRAIIAMARQLHLEVTVEGVETQAQAAFLKAEGSHRWQGHYYSQPLPAPEIAPLLGRLFGASLAGSAA